MYTHPALVLGSSFYTAALEKPFEVALGKRGAFHSITCVPYSQLTNFLLNPSTSVADGESTRVVVLLRVEDLIRLELAALRDHANVNPEACLAILQQRASEFLEILDQAKNIRYSLLMCPSGKGAYDTATLGNALRLAEHKIAAKIRVQQKHLFIPWHEFEQATVAKNLFNPAGDRLGHVPFTPEGLNAIAEYFADQLDRIPIAQNGETAVADTGNLARFLASLNVELEVSALTSEKEERALELMRHTTHFINKPGAKWEKGDLAKLAAQRRDTTMWHLAVRDRFGAYETSGAVLFGTDGRSLQVKLLFLTCPVLGKQVEYALFQRLAVEAERRGAEVIEISVDHGRDNSVLSDLLVRLSDESNAVNPAVGALGSSTLYKLRVAGLTETLLQAAPNPDALKRIVSGAGCVEGAA